jgi:2-polyprenyl-6-methoxyphenol hydroxylase-like FAD-dependent oxidoreductase
MLSSSHEVNAVRTAIVGAGPTGLYLAVALARRGHQVTVVDRDPGPRADGSWPRKGVMQFHHPHGFRGQVVDAILAEMPDVFDALVAAGAEPTMIPQQPGRIVGMRCRRATFERVLRAAALAQPGVELRRGHADDVAGEGGHAVGLVVDGRRVDADLVLEASGRAGRLSQGRRAPARGGDCGLAYVSRQYRLLPGAEEGPVNSPIGMLVSYPAYQVVVFPHDNRTFSTLVARLASDRELGTLRHQGAFEAACRAIPALATWTDPDRSEPITPVLPGGRLTNSYQGQRDANGRIALDGLIFVGDAVCTTTPTAGRGVATSLMQAARLLELLDEHPQDLTTCALVLEDWCDSHIQPWFEDHVAMDADQVHRWSGRDIDLSKRLPSDVILGAAEADPTMMQVAGPYLGMQALPSSLAALEPRAREIYAGGWRPAVPAGPSRDELATMAAEVVAATDR